MQNQTDVEMCEMIKLLNHLACWSSFFLSFTVGKENHNWIVKLFFRPLCSAIVLKTLVAGINSDVVSSLWHRTNGNTIEKVTGLERIIGNVLGQYLVLARKGKLCIGSEN